MGQCAYVEVWNRVTHEHSQLSFTIHDIKLRRKQLIQQKDYLGLFQKKEYFTKKDLHTLQRAQMTRLPHPKAMEHFFLKNCSHVFPPWQVL